MTLSNIIKLRHEIRNECHRCEMWLGNASVWSFSNAHCTFLETLMFIVLMDGSEGNNATIDCVSGCKNMNWPISP